jgi:hypothetical protein
LRNDRIAIVLALIAARYSETEASKVDQDRLVVLLAGSSTSAAIGAGLHEFLFGFQRECAALAYGTSAAYMRVD